MHLDNYWDVWHFGYSIGNRNSSHAHVKLHLRVPKIFPNLLECFLFQVLVFPAGLPSPAKYTADCVL